VGRSDDVVRSGCVERGLPLAETYLCFHVDHGHVMASVEPLDRQLSAYETTLECRLVCGTMNPGLLVISW
jgi:hypothetical protein